MKPLRGTSAEALRYVLFFFSSRRRHTRCSRDWSSDVCSSDLGLNVSYIVGAGDEMPQSLVNLGINVHFLTAEDLAAGNLSKFDAIVLGVRTYAVREDLKTYNEIGRAHV